jgi:hypothetical protein
LPPAPAAPPGASELHPIARLAAQKHAASKTKDGNLGDSDESLDDIDTLPCSGSGKSRTNAVARGVPGAQYCTLSTVGAGAISSGARVGEA